MVDMVSKQQDEWLSADSRGVSYSIICNKWQSFLHYNGFELFTGEFSRSPILGFLTNCCIKLLFDVIY